MGKAVIQIDTMVDLRHEDGEQEAGREGPDTSAGKQFRFGGPLGSIAGRIRFASWAIATVLVALGILVGLAFIELTSRNDETRILGAGALASAELTSAISDTRYYSSRFAVTGDAAEIERAHDALGLAVRRLEETRAMAADADPKMMESIEWLQAEVEGFEGELTALERSVGFYGPSPSASALAAAIDINGEQLAKSARGVEARLATSSSESAEALKRLNSRLTFLAIGLIAICLLLSVVGFRYLASDIAGSLRRITAAMTGLAAGDQEIDIPGADRRDEIGTMARALTVFRDSAQELAALQAEAAETARKEIARREQVKQKRIALTADLAAKFEETVGNVVGNVASASSQLLDTANAMAATAAQASNLAGEVAVSMDGTSTGVTAAASACDQFAMSIGEISRQAANSASLAHEARVTAEQADATIGTLASASEQIGAIVELIRSIAERTNLLSLNASIEAARGGEAGRGFAVVATEVKELANRTSHATQQVAGQILEIQRSSHASVAALRAIEDQVRQVEANAAAIAQSVDEQSVASQHLAKNLDMAAGGTGQVRTSVGQVREMSLATGSAATQVADSATGLRKQAVELRLQVDQFLNYVKAA